MYTEQQNKYKQYNQCTELRYLSQAFSIPEIALLWCGVTDDDKRREFLAQCEQQANSGIGRGIYVHPYIDCVELKTQVIAHAMESNQLKFSRDGGVDKYNNEDNVSWERRCVRGSELKAYLTKHYPNEKPAFLFDEIERGTHEKVSLEAYQSLKATNEALQVKLEAYELLKHENNALNKQIEALQKQNKTGSTLETTNRNALIGAFIEITTGKRDGIPAIFDNEQRAKDYLIENYGGDGGLGGFSISTLNKAFAEANKAVNQS